MNLSEKGHFAARPALQGPAELLARTVEGWASVQARTHWQLGDETIVDGADFYVGQRGRAGAPVSLQRRLRGAPREDDGRSARDGVAVPARVRPAAGGERRGAAGAD